MLSNWKYLSCRHEGRTWPTTHRGRLWIAAAAKSPDDEEIEQLENFYKQYYDGKENCKLIILNHLVNNFF